MQVISKKEAKNKELKRYFTGIMCKNGHVAERLASSGECIGCKIAREKRKYTEGQSEYRKQYYQDNREEKVQKQMDRQNANHDEYLLYQKQWRDENKGKIKRYQTDNPAVFAHHAAKRRKKVKIATPYWFEELLVKKVYEESARLTKETGIEHHVDHVVPLKNKKVCGLHCIDNLQVLTAEENMKKKNTFIV